MKKSKHSDPTDSETEEIDTDTDPSHWVAIPSDIYLYSQEKTSPSGIKTITSSQMDSLLYGSNWSQVTEEIHCSEWFHFFAFSSAVEASHYFTHKVQESFMKVFESFFYVFYLTISLNKLLYVVYIARIYLKDKTNS